MKVLICGSRDWTDVAAVRARVWRLPWDAVVITGMAVGADTLARRFTLERGLWVVDVPCRDEHWRHHGKSAGHKRNHVMLDLGPELVIAFQWDGSSGTQGTIDEARRRGIDTEVHIMSEEGAAA